MWPFRKKEKKRSRTKLFVGLIIGGAIATTVGKKIMDKHAEREDDENEKE